MTPDHLTTVARAHAPVLAQKVAAEWPAADQIAPLDLAGSLRDVADNVAHLFALAPDAEIPDPTVYFAASETPTHVFLIYMVYHVFDWWKRDTPRNLYDRIRDRLDEHAHDLEGALFVLRKEPRLTLDATVTVSHRNFYLYARPLLPPEKRGGRPVSGVRGALHVTRFHEDVDGHVWIDRATRRVKLYIQARGHGIRGDHAGWGGGESIRYYKPEGVGGKPGTIAPDEPISVRVYRLQDLFLPGGVWEHRYDRRVFRQRENGQWGLVCRRELTRGGLLPSAANPPWSWNDHNDPSPMGEMATDPARFISRYAQGWGPVSLHYLHNPFLSEA